MTNVNGYSHQKLIHQGPHTLVYSAVRDSDGEPVVLKQLRTGAATVELNAQYRKECELLQSLDADTIITCHELINEDGVLSLVLEHFDGLPLAELIKDSRPSLVDAIRVTLAIADTLDYIHSKKIIHKDINPANILCDANFEKIKVIDFSLATLQSSSNSQSTNNIIEGTLAYLSPEQTGRMNRSVDYRSDLYSLGALLFQLLTGQTPFDGKDDLEVVFQHLAREPIAPSSICPELPEALDRIVLKLLQKSPEDRYQSTHAIRQDLKHCYDLLLAGGNKIPDFEIALDDVPEQLNISDRLLQRDDQRATLKKIFNQFENDQSRAVSIIGEAGTGKSTLLREIHRITVSRNGMIATSRPSVISSDVPYSALTESLKELARQLLSRPDLPLLQKGMAQSFGQGLSLITDLAPELKTVLGETPEAEKRVLSPQENQNRLLTGISGFLSFLSTRASPIVLCVDNFQWADQASISVFEALLTKFRPPGLIFVSACTTHPDASLSSHLNTFFALARAQKSLTVIKTSNLDISNVALLISDSLFRSIDESQELAAVIHGKTSGNPQALREFINYLYDNQVIFFDRDHREWDWNLDAIRSQSASENVGEVLSRKIQDLEPNTSRVLKIAACIGHEFDLNTIKTVSEMSFSETSSRLLQAVRDGYLVRTERSANEESVKYRFAHESIQQAAYTLLEVVERRQIHAHIGQAYLHETGSEPIDNIFDIVNQLNNSFENPEAVDIDRFKLAQLNLTAGRRAKQGAAFQAAFRYLRTAIALQGSNVWDHYDLSLDIHLEAAEAAYLCGDRRQLETLIQATLTHAKTPIDKCRAYEVQLRALLAYNELETAIDIGHSVLLLLGHPIRQDIGRVQLFFWQVQLLIRTRKVHKTALDQMPKMTDPTHRAVMRILTLLSQAGYLAGRESTASYILKMTELSLKYGMAPETSFAYPMFGALTITYFGTIQSGYKFGILAQANLDDSNRELHARTNTLVHNFIMNWKHHLKESLEPLANAYQVGFETGDIESAMIAAMTSQASAFVLGHDLNTLDTNLTNYNAKAHEFSQTPMLSMGSIYQQAVKNLINPTTAPWLLQGEIYHEAELLQFHQTSGDESSVANLFIVKLFLAVLFGRPEHAMTFAQEARSKINAVVSSPAVPFFILYESLAYISQLSSSAPWQRLKLAYRIRLNLRLLRKWAHHAPENILHAYHMVEAELARASNNPTLAIDNYELAIYYAKEHGYLKDHGFACELAGRFYDANDKHELAIFHFRKARASYIRWGAMTKVQALDKEFIELTDDSYLNHHASSQTTYSVSSYGEDASNYRGNFLDLSSVIKASQVLSGEIILSNLLERLMQVALENAGAHSACLLLTQGDELQVEITSRFNGSTTEHQLKSIPINEFKEIPISVVQYVARTQEDLVLGDPANEDIFTQDDYVVQHNPKSILCFPILSKSHLTGVLYLENLHSTHAFTQDRVAVLKLLASQSAIAIENAKLYKQLSDSKNKYLSLYENAVEGIFEVNLDGEVINANPAAAQLIGFSGDVEEHPNDIDIDKLFVDQVDISQLRTRILDEERVMGFETQLKRLDNRQIWVVMSAKLIKDEDGTPSHVEGSIIDITERKLRQQAEQATRLAEAATETKSQFLANMSHEIRTPMNAILGYTELALKTELTEQQTNYLSTIKNSSGHLLRVVNDILDISKVESGKLELQNVPFKLSQIFRDIENLFDLTAKQKGIELILPTTGDDIYMGDPVRIGQVLINLVNNALKFTPSGTVRVDLEIMPLHDGSSCLNFTVSDTGIGIAESDLEIIFESFTQTTTESNESGTGLGLAICRNLVEMMQGHIHATSTPGEGSQFYFSIVINSAADDAEVFEPISVKQQIGEGLELLLVEDNKINQELAKEVLEASGFKVTVANNGVEALDILEDSNVAVVLMDLRMPVMDGNETIEIIRQRPNLRHLPVIALSAGVLGQSTGDLLHAGFDHYISKPVDFQKLLALIAEICGLQSVAESAPETDVSVGEIMGIDFAQALRSHGNDDALLGRLLSEFVKIYNHADEDLANFVASDMQEKAERLTHNIAGVAGSFGASSLMHTARQLEHKLIANRNQDELLSAEDMKPFETELHNFVSAIEQYWQEARQSA